MIDIPAPVLVQEWGPFDHTPDDHEVEEGGLALILASRLDPVRQRDANLTRSRLSATYHRAFIALTLSVIGAER